VPPLLNRLSICPADDVLSARASAQQVLGFRLSLPTVFASAVTPLSVHASPGVPRRPVRYAAGSLPDARSRPACNPAHNPQSAIGSSPARWQGAVGSSRRDPRVIGAFLPPSLTNMYIRFRFSPQAVRLSNAKKVLACYATRAICSHRMLQERAVSAGSSTIRTPVPLAESRPFKPLSPKVVPGAHPCCFHEFVGRNLGRAVLGVFRSFWARPRQWAPRDSTSSLWTSA
jgi:hypothetical protein